MVLLLYWGTDKDDKIQKVRSTTGQDESQEENESVLRMLAFLIRTLVLECHIIFNPDLGNHVQALFSECLRSDDR